MSINMRRDCPGEITSMTIEKANRLQDRLDEQLRAIHEENYVPDEVLGDEPIKDSEFKELNAELFLMGEEVEVHWGRRLEVTTNQEYVLEGITGLILANTVKSPVVGVCRGIDTMMTHTLPARKEPEDLASDIKTKVVHVVQTGDSVVEKDIFGKLHMSTDLSYVTVNEGSMLYPVEPIDAHTSAILRDKEKARTLERMVSSRTNLLTAIKRIMYYFETHLVTEGGLYVACAPIHEELSYVNMLLKERRYDDSEHIVQTDDWIKGRPSRHQTPDTYSYGRVGEKISANWSHVTVLPEYRRYQGDKRKVIFTNQYSLYLRAEDENGDEVAIPLRSIDAIS